MRQVIARQPLGGPGRVSLNPCNVVQVGRSRGPDGYSGHPTDSGTLSAGSSFAQYSVLTLVLAGSQRNAGTPNRVPRSIIFRRVSGIGDAPNSIPRVSVLPFQGGFVRLWFSSQIPSHGKSDRFQI